MRLLSYLLLQHFPLGPQPIAFQQDRVLKAKMLITLPHLSSAKPLVVHQAIRGQPASLKLASQFADHRLWL